ncbi:alpha-ketoglutarate-dependent dioxygenase AlkB [Phenylobacterium sp.]|uniref:alpha-ketoglutarate-dependent dioxygenase AlkB n=1 Tax=Phenylobacterium sp. TaxID=1871053 RepID=UPI0025E60DB3|nr:alpha-ketoglutarate-dependent dioxygenase AlkB [Phenylobacterium sp.]MBX3484438.1 alpha-ketoglutarate-dependent dioxygenase AlkB [Phenylobacterium sp.]
MTLQTDLFGSPLEPEGLRYEPALVTPDEQAPLMAVIADLPFAPFEFHGWLGARRVVSFGWRYDFTRGRLDQAAPLPLFLHDLRDRAARFAAIDPTSIGQTLVTEYAPGAGIGWHRDRPQYDKVIGVSFGAPCRMRFRRKAGAAWERRHLDLAPGSAYLLDGPSRHDWEHSIPPLADLRYSVTFRTLTRT